VFAELHGGTLELVESPRGCSTIQVSIPVKQWEPML
jgi:signal transduction histidine kinase